MRTKLHHLTIVLLLLFTVFAYFNTFETIEHRLQDRLYQTGGTVDTQIVIIGIDEPSLERLERWPWPRRRFAELINLLAPARPAVIAVDVIFSEPAADPADDAALAQAIRDFPAVVVPLYGVFPAYSRAGNLVPDSLVTPVPSLAEASIPGHINTFPDPDGIVRRTALYFDYAGTRLYSFNWQSYTAFMHNTAQTPVSLDTIPLDSWNRMHIDYTGKPGEFECISFHRVLDGEIPPEYFTDKIVLVGPYAAGLAFSDYYFAPTEPQAPMFGIEVNANIIQNLLTGRFHSPLPFGLTLLILGICAALGYFAFQRLSPLPAFLTLAGSAALYLAGAKQLYDGGYIAPLFYPLALLGLLYLLTLAYRYLAELRERQRVTGIFGRYVAPQIVHEILKEGEAGLQLGGIRREVTALFVDIRGFTPLSEKMTPEEIVGILNEYLDLCARAIFQYEGTLDKFIGDATMALFNAPLDLDDHAYRAVRAALAMREGSAALQQKLEEKYGRSVSFGIGINTGFAVVGNIGATFRMDYTAIGDTINTAARLESNAKPGQILLSQATYDRVKDRVDAAYLGEYTMKGKQQGIPVYQLERVR